MRTYLRMLRMIRPYLTQVVAGVVFMVLFSFFSVFSVTMLSPFMQALFSESQAPIVTQMAEPEQSPAGVLEGEVAAGDDRPGDKDVSAGNQRLDQLQSQVQQVTGLKARFKTWVAEHLLQGSKQDMLLRVCLTFFVLILIKNVTGYLAQVAMVYVGESLIRDLRNQLFQRFTQLPLGFYHQNKAGELISRATNDVLMAQKCVGVSFTTLVRDPLYIVMALAVALIISWKMTLLALLLMPASLVVIIRIGKGLRHISRRQQEEMANLTSTLQETVYGVRVIKAFAMEDFENRKFLARSSALFREVFRYNWIMKMSSPLTEQLSTLVGLFLLWYGGSKVFTGGLMAPDMFLVFLFCIFSMVRPIKNLGQVNNEIQAGMAAAERIFAVLDTAPEVADPTAGKLLGAGGEGVTGQVELREVHFSYIPGEPVLRGISLRVEPGEVVALVGGSGGGKSTLIDMIPGFYLADQGQVLVDGLDVRELNLASLRRSMGIVTQEVILFHDTIARNIAYGLDDVSLEDIRAAARAANADDFIMKLPKGYDTIIGDRGLKLSGGQRQRLSIARAILKNPPILLLDEATSALDTEAEQLVQEAIDRLVQHRTTIVIAHRLSTIQNVDRIYLLEQGEVVQVGTHDELLAAGGRYRELYEMQFRA